MANDDKVDAHARVQAYDLAARMDQAILTLISNTPATLARSLELPKNLIEERRDLNLRLVVNYNNDNDKQSQQRQQPTT